MYIPIIAVKPGQSGTEFLAKNNLAAKGHIDKQPAGINFYEYNWSVKQYGSVAIEHGPHSFTIPHALSVMGTEDPEHPNLGLSQVSVGAGIGHDETISHDEARKRIYDFLNMLAGLGWIYYNDYSEPRLTGAQAFQYHLDNDLYSIPINYLPTLDEWMRIYAGEWRLHTKEMFLSIRLMRDKTRLDPKTPGAYFLNFTLQTKEDFARAHFNYEERDKWPALWVDTIKKMKKERYSKEAALIKRGFIIDTTYQDPQIHPADPVEP